MRVTLSGTEGALDSLRVREVTRRRGVGQYLLEEVLRNPAVSCWWMADAGVEDRGVMTAFMQALGFTAQQGGWGEALIALCEKQFDGFGWEK